MEQNINKENQMQTKAQAQNRQSEKTNKTYSVEEILKMVNESNKNNTALPKEIEMLINSIKGEESKESEKNTKQSLSMNYIEGLSLEDIKKINEYAYKQVENYTKAPFNMENMEHREYFEYFKQQALKEKEKQIKMKKFDESLHEKYGEMYESVEKAARNTFESMAFKDARDIISSRMHGNVEKLLSFYDSVFNEMVSKQKQAEDVVHTQEGRIMFPPKALNGSSVKTTANKNTYENFI